MSQIVDFFVNNKTGPRNMTLDQVLNLSNTQFEASHDIIQWLFPLHEKSYHSLNSPVLSQDDIDKLSNSNLAQSNMRRNLIRFQKFLGINEFNDIKRQNAWAFKGNHNLLRITRAIRSLRLFNLTTEAHQLYNDVIGVIANKDIPNTAKYWEDAWKQDKHESMTKRFLEEKNINIMSED